MQLGWRARRALASQPALELCQKLQDVRAMLAEVCDVGKAPSAGSYEAAMLSGLRGQLRKQVTDLVSMCAKPLPPQRSALKGHGTKRPMLDRTARGSAWLRLALAPLRPEARQPEARPRLEALRLMHVYLQRTTRAKVS